MKLRKTLKLSAAVVATAVIVSSGVALAATQNFLANVKFATPLTLTKVKDLNFGIVKANAAGSYVLSTAGIVTASGGGAVVGGVQQAGQLTVTGSSTQTLNISTDGLTPDNGVTPSAPTCKYDASVEAPCNLTNQVAPGAGKTLLLGLTIAAPALPDNATAAPSFNVNVVYN